MAMTLPRGGNISVQAALAAGDGRLRVYWEWGGDSPVRPAVEAMVFAIKADGGVRSEADMLSQDQPQAADGMAFLHKLQGLPEINSQYCDIDTHKIPADIEKLCFCLVLHSQAGGVTALNQLSPLICRINSSQEILAETSLSAAAAAETAMVVAELYRRQGEWKFKSVGQGYQSGLTALAQHFGVKLAVDAQAAPVQYREASTTPLIKTPPFATITPPREGLGQIDVHLTWAALPKVAPAPEKKGFLSGLLGRKAAPTALDLDLCCLFELSDGYRGIVQSLGGSMGAYQSAPFMELLGDARAGAGTGHGGEVLRINGNRWSEVKRVLIYAMIFEGVPNWHAAAARVAIRMKDQLPIGIKLDQNIDNQRACTVAVLENIQGALVVHKRVETFKNPREIDQHYQWGLQWKAGLKD